MYKRQQEELAQRLQGHIEQLQRTIDALVRDARRPLRSGLTAACDATAVIRERVTFWAALAEDQGRRLDVSVPDHPVPVGLERADLVDLLDVLVDNVFAHTPDATPFAVALVADPGEVVLEVRDAGPGLPADEVVGGGAGQPTRPGTSGLGLQIVRRTAARVGGHLTLEDAAPGLRARVRLPAVGAEAHRPGTAGHRG